MVPSPVPVLTVTVYVAPEPLTLAMDAPVTPLVVKSKSPTSTPVTASEKVTVKFTLAALVGLASARKMEVTVGAVLSIVYSSPLA
ncbi:MAG: hypothetical protein PGMFKBFP_01267 [Anaerolineales bacterium]|nr:hypothetical protein [Anaerolineales bacterium]